MIVNMRSINYWLDHLYISYNHPICDSLYNIGSVNTYNSMIVEECDSRIGS